VRGRAGGKRRGGRRSRASADGVVLQHLVPGPQTIGEPAERLGVSQQAASKSIAVLEALGGAAAVRSRRVRPRA
jgi:DNA-binding transcriptional LysR family regulator